MSVLHGYLTSQALLLALVGAILRYSITRARASRLLSLTLPPGPPETGWLSGHLSILPGLKPWKVYADWAKEYGPIVHLQVYGHHTVLLSSMQDCIELFEKRSNIYSDRPVITMINLMGWDFNGAFLRYGPQWQRQRRIFQQAFKKASVHAYRQEQTRKVNDMLYSLLTKPDDFIEHTRMLAAAIVMSITYGYDIEDTNDYFVNVSEDAEAQLSLAVLPGAALVNALPILRHLPPWFPGAGFHKVASQSRDMVLKMKEVPMSWVQNNVSAGVQSNCLVSERLPACKTKEEFITLQEFAAMVYGAGADTTISALKTFFYVMTIFPDVQKKAQQELDTVVGNNRLPNFDDQNSLPYLDALVREVLRWAPVAPLGLGHSLTQDDIFKGYRMPKGCVVMANVWAITRDETRYKSPEEFNPDRFFDQTGNLIDDDISYVFGFGRRICPGRHLVRATIWLTAATTLWSFKISKPRDDLGNEVPVHTDYTDGLVSHPLPHKCSITPRLETTARIIEEEVARTRERTG